MRDNKYTLIHHGFPPHNIEGLEDDFDPIMRSYSYNLTMNLYNDGKLYFNSFFYIHLLTKTRKMGLVKLFQALIFSNNRSLAKYLPML